MPIYEYRRADGTTFEVMQKFSDDPLTHDPETGDPVELVYRPPAIHFKGKGFHNTDYGTRKRRTELEKSADSGADKHAAESKAKSESKSEAKPAASGDPGSKAA